MTKFQPIILFLLYLAISSPVAAQDGATFMLPVSPTGEQIHDVNLLTITNQVDRSAKTEQQKTNLQTAKDAPAQIIVKQKNLKFQKMQEQLQELSLLWEQMRNKQIEEASQQPQKNEQETVTSQQVPIIEESPIPTEPQQLEIPSPLGNETVIDPIEAVLENTGIINSEKDKTVRSDADVATETEIPAQSVSGPVDRFALATSLYAVGHFNESLQAIESVQLKDLTTHEMIWLDYLRAGCHRQLGAASEANRLYRRIVANPEAGWVGDVSRWWVDHSSEKLKLEADQLTLNTAMKQWEAAVNELTE